ncbi:HD domain-containing phosphohydrolase [Candidatus Omnitrophota bacterium]
MDWHIRNVNLEGRRRSFESLRIQVSNLSGVVDISSRFSDRVSVDHLLSLILKQTMDAMNVRICAIWLKDKKGNLIPRISFGLKTRMIRKIKIKSGSSFFGSIIKRNDPLSITDLDKITSRSFKKLIDKEDLRSILASPLAIEDEKLGILMICARKPHQFSGSEIQIFDAIARQAALAIGNAGLYEKMGRKFREKAKKMEAIFSMSRTITSSINEGTIFDFILEKTAKLMKADACVLSLFDRTSSRLSLKSYLGIDKKGAEKLKCFEKPFSKEVFNTELPCMINDLHDFSKGNMPEFIREKNINSLIVMPLIGPKRKVGVLSVYMSDVRVFSREDIELLEMIGSLCSITIENLNMLERIKEDYLNMVKTLAKIIDANDKYTCGHCEKVMKYSLMICKKLKLRPRSKNAVKMASLLHDIGKIGIDIDIVRKTGDLTRREKEKISLHSEIGARIINQLGFLGDIVPIIRHHHERYEGGGYPDPDRSGADIPLGARILAVADAYDAMTSDRPYRKAMQKQKAIEELKKCRYSQFDPVIVDAFLKSVNKKNKVSEQNS